MTRVPVAFYLYTSQVNMTIDVTEPQKWRLYRKTSIPNAALMVVPSMFTAATPVDAASKTVGFSGFIGACL